MFKFDFTVKLLIVFRKCLELCSMFLCFIINEWKPLRGMQGTSDIAPQSKEPRGCRRPSQTVDFDSYNINVVNSLKISTKLQNLNIYVVNLS